MEEKRFLNEDNLKADKPENEDGLMNYDRQEKSKGLSEINMQLNPDVSAKDDLQDNSAPNPDDGMPVGSLPDVTDNPDQSNDTETAQKTEETASEATATESETSDKKPVKVKKTRGQTYKKLKSMMKTTKTMAICSSRVDMYKYLAKQFEKLGDYKKSAELAEKCRKKAKKTKKLIKMQIYENAVNLKNNASKPEDYKLAAMELRKLQGYLDADELAIQCDLMAEKLEKRLTIKRIGLVSFLAVLIVFAIIAINTPFAQYRLANLLVYTGSYDTAIKFYNRLGAYSNAEEKLKETQYKKGISLMEDGSYKEALKAMKSAAGFFDSEAKKAEIEKLIIKASKVGDTVSFGKYDWLVAEIVDNKALLVMKKTLPGLLYHESTADITWENSSLRKWLNSVFLDEAFSDEEQKDIILSRTINSPNPSYNTDGGNDTEDYIFIFSIDEAIKYNEIIPKSDYNTWLRTPGSSRMRAAFLTSDKSIMESGYEANSDKLAARPVLWYNLE